MNIWESAPSSPCAGAGRVFRPWRRPRAHGRLTSQITLYYRPEDIMVFDAESEALIA